MYFLVKQSDLTQRMLNASTSTSTSQLPPLELYGIISNTPYYIVEVSDITSSLVPDSLLDLKMYTAEELLEELSDTEKWIRP